MNIILGLQLVKMKIIDPILILGATCFIFSCSEPVGGPKNDVRSASLDTNSFKEKGMGFAVATKQQLANNLIRAITASGTTHALEFCSSKAVALTDSMGEALGANIRRVSDKPRNAQNRARGKELRYIEQGKGSLASGYDLTPEIYTEGRYVIGLYPIITNAMCLQCHGSPNEEIQPATLDKIATLYPEDLATGYNENELRGVWVVEMNQ